MADPGHGQPPQVVVQGAEPPRFGEVQIRDRGRLPHWEKEEGLYFVTFRLADSLPEEVVRKIVERKKMLEEARRIGAYLTPAQEVLAAKYSREGIETFFDIGAGECLLGDTRVAGAMARALGFWHGKRYRTAAWCIMPNHVHVVFRLLPGQRIADTVRGWKVYVAREANRILGRRGPLWQREYYDRLLRPGEFDRAIEYVLRNPEKAGLRDWRWVWAEGREALRTAGQETGATAGGLETGATPGGQETGAAVLPGGELDGTAIAHVTMTTFPGGTTSSP